MSIEPKPLTIIGIGGVGESDKKITVPGCVPDFFTTCKKSFTRILSNSLAYP